MNYNNQVYNMALYERLHRRPHYMTLISNIDAQLKNIRTPMTSYLYRLFKRPDKRRLKFRG